MFLLCFGLNTRFTTFTFMVGGMWVAGCNKMLITSSLYVLRAAPLVPGHQNPPKVPEVIDLENPRRLLEDWLRTTRQSLRDSSQAFTLYSLIFPYASLPNLSVYTIYPNSCINVLTTFQGVALTMAHSIYVGVFRDKHGASLPSFVFISQCFHSPTRNIYKSCPTW